VVARTLWLKWWTCAQTLFWCSVTLSTNVPIGELLQVFELPQYQKCSVHPRTRPTKIWSGFCKQHSSGQLRAVRNIIAEKTPLIEDKDIWQEGLMQSDIHDIRVGGTAVWNPSSLVYVPGARTWAYSKKDQFRQILFYHSGVDKDSNVLEFDAVCFDKKLPNFRRDFPLNGLPWPWWRGNKFLWNIGMYIYQSSCRHITKTCK
jgi:hypothetical protein